MIGLEAWDISVTYEEDGDTACAKAEPRYRNLTINFSPSRAAESDDLEELVVHELCHALTWRLWDFNERTLEQHYGDKDADLFRWLLEEIHEEAVTLIAFALLRARQGLATSET